MPYYAKQYLTTTTDEKPEKTLPKAKKPINKVSKKRVIENQEYSEKRKLYLLTNPNCMAKLSICSGKSTQVHHKKGRIGKLLTNVRYFMAVCFECHEWIEKNPIEAKKQGYSVKRLSVK